MRTGDTTGDENWKSVAHGKSTSAEAFAFHHVGSGCELLAKSLLDKV
jgi:hypothetical protein